MGLERQGKIITCLTIILCCLASASYQQSCQQGCQTCISYYQCLSCNPGYYLSGYYCFSCISNCDSCLDSTSCEQCASGYILSTDNIGFEECILNGTPIPDWLGFLIMFSICFGCICCCAMCCRKPTPAPVPIDYYTSNTVSYSPQAQQAYFPPPQQQQYYTPPPPITPPGYATGTYTPPGVLVSPPPFTDLSSPPPFGQNNEGVNTNYPVPSG